LPLVFSRVRVNAGDILSRPTRAPLKTNRNMNTSHRAISTPDGRKLGISQAGQPDGVPMLVLRGTPHSRLLYDGWGEHREKRPESPTWAWH
jgi:hypothetical protein